MLSASHSGKDAQAVSSVWRRAEMCVEQGFPVLSSFLLNWIRVSSCNKLGIKCLRSRVPTQVLLLVVVPNNGQGINSPYWQAESSTNLSLLYFSTPDFELNQRTPG